MSMGNKTRAGERGFSLVVTLTIVAGVSMLVGGVLYYTSTQSTLTRRSNQYDSSLAAAVAATEKVVTRINRDFQVGGQPTVNQNLSNYRGLVPTDDELRKALTDPNLLQAVLDILGGGGSGSSQSSTTPQPVWTKYEFANAQGQLNQTHVELISDWSFRELQTRFTGLRGYAADYRIISNARELNRPYHIVSAVKQEVQVASIPLCQYQFYYVPDLEFHPLTAGIQLNGRVHCNGSIYLEPGVSTTFQNHLSAVRRILHRKHPLDSTIRPSAAISYRAERESGVNSLNLPVGTNSGPMELRAILEAPPAGESTTSSLWAERLYNKADLLITVSNDVVTARSGTYNGSSVTVPWLASRGIVQRNSQGFYDPRQCEYVQLSEFDLAKLLANYDALTILLGRPAKVIWITDLGGDGIDDSDTIPGGKGKKKKPKKSKKGLLSSLFSVEEGPTNRLSAVRLINGQTLPTAGLTIVTPDPLYVRGSFNLNSAPACLASDAITILSGNWADANGGQPLGSRVAADLTINAAIVSGIIPTEAGTYSGGAENALRLVEDWTGRTLTFNGSLAVLFYSEFARAPWGGPGVYAPPTRAWRYDVNLAEAAKTPPGMPAARTIFRTDWTVIRPYTKL